MTESAQPVSELATFKFGLLWENFRLPRQAELCPIPDYPIAERIAVNRGDGLRKKHEQVESTATIQQQWLEAEFPQ